MAESSDRGDNRDEKRRKMRECLDRSFSDPLLAFSTPAIVRKISKELDDEAAQLEGRIRKVSGSSDSPVGDTREKAVRYLNQRQEVVEDLETHLNKSRNAVRNSRGEELSGSTKNKLKKAFHKLDENEYKLLRERTALTAHRLRLEVGLCSQPSHVKFGDAYMMALTDSLPKPADGSYKKMQGRDKSEQSAFRRLLTKTYNKDGSKILQDVQDGKAETPIESWCPVNGEHYFHEDMKAAHIIPHAIKPETAAYLLGVEPKEGPEMMWSERNGLMLHEKVEALFDDGRLVIIPDPQDTDEFISVILCPKLLKSTKQGSFGAPHSFLHMKRLQFQTDARPGKRYLYIRTLISLFLRRRYDVPGCGTDKEKVLNGKIWASPDGLARRSMVEAIALEVGDSWEGDKPVEGLRDFPGTKSPEEEKKMALVTRYDLEIQRREEGEDR